jgi:hypothetical protein
MNKDWIVEEKIISLEVPITFWEFQLPETPEYSRDFLHSEIERIIRETGDKRGRTTNVKAIMTDWLMTHHAPFKFICDNVEDIIQSWYLEKTSLTLETFMTTCWGSIYSKGDFAERHAHVPALHAWVYYAKVNENSAPLYFPNSPTYTYKPRSGYGIIFPGWLVHETPIHQSNDERIIVVGNVEGTGAVEYPQKRKFLHVSG